MKFLRVTTVDGEDCLIAVSQIVRVKTCTVNIDDNEIEGSSIDIGTEELEVTLPIAVIDAMLQA